ncbi:hypothetical protein [Actinoplanes sp. NPDC026623]|uniref:hypothetical protein n=1 Tax=Actinoplanes sp. NPDC026623 TaxID=3155610 RepID=UPI0033EC76EE
MPPRSARARTPSGPAPVDGRGAETEALGSEDESSAVGLLNTSAKLGNALGIAVLLGVAALPRSGPTAGYLVAAVAGLLSAALVVRYAAPDSAPAHDA